MSDALRPSSAFLMSDGTAADFEEFFRKDPIGAAQYASALAKVHQTPVEGIDDLQTVLEQTDLPIEARKSKLLELATRKPNLFTFVPNAETALRASRDHTLGWNIT